jgi:predicted nucleic acid-binding protein
VTPLVVDASVAVKWFFRSREAEADVVAALGILRAVAIGQVALIQPPHFVAEVTAVLAREAPQTAATARRDLLDIEVAVADEPNIYRRAMALAIPFRHHVFDTLYHAVALETPGAMLVTADARYLRNARAAGRIVLLAGFELS